MNQAAQYKKELTERYWAYQERYFPDIQTFFDQPNIHNHRPPVFVRTQARHNILTNPKATDEETKKLLQLLPIAERHKWFGSMNSSQALAQSILGNLAIHDQLHCLAGLVDEMGLPIFGEAIPSSKNFSMEHKVSHLAEPRATSLDGFISGAYQVAIECKFTEAEVGACSRPSLLPSASNYFTDRCSGAYAVQSPRKERCSLTEIGVRYWKHVPQLFTWQSDKDIELCPLHRNYQLVRNILAVCVRPDGTTSPKSGHPKFGHVVLIYDERNPAFRRDGDGLRAYDETRDALLDTSLLRKFSWQQIIRHLEKQAKFRWLTEQLAQKYGLT